MKAVFIAMILIGTLTVGVVAKPEKVVNLQVANNKVAVNTLGDYSALTNAIMTAKSVDDLQPILLKIVGAAYTTEAGKDKKNK